jgi:YaiO family outer membrane protein
MTLPRRCRAGVAWAAYCGVSALGLAAGVQASPLTLEAAHSVERLSAGLKDWRQTEMFAHWRDPAGGAAGWAAGGALRRTERFGFIDSQVEASAALPLAASWRGEAEASVSATHQVLPAWRWRARVWRDGIQGWNLALGTGRTLYRGASAAQGSTLVELQAERYVADWRFAWVGSATRLDAGNVGSAHVWSANWYAHERLALGGVFGFGRELENLPNAGVVSSSVRSLALKAQWTFRPTWSLSVEASSQRQGEIYERNGLRLGLRLQH